MKKTFFVIITLVLAMVCCVACTDQGGYKAIEEAFEKQYSNVNINVTVAKDGVTLKGEYKLSLWYNGNQISYATVDYSYDELNKLSLDGNNGESYITVVSGQKKVSDGKLDSVEINGIQLDYGGFRFKTDYFENVYLSETVFETDVVDVKSFVGNDAFDGTDMHVRLTYSPEQLETVSITYISATGAKVSVNYSFTL